MEHVVIPNQEDKQRVQEAIASYANYDNESLVAFYNKQVKLGLVGVKAQTIHVIACGIVCKTRFGFNPASCVGIGCQY